MNEKSRSKRQGLHSILRQRSRTVNQFFFSGDNKTIERAKLHNKDTSRNRTTANIGALKDECKSFHKKRGKTLTHMCSCFNATSVKFLHERGFDFLKQIFCTSI